MKSIEQEAMAFIEAHLRQLRPIARESNLAGWVAATTGSESAIRRSAEARTALKRLYSDREAFERTRAFLASESIQDTMVARQLTLLSHAYTANQLRPEMIADLSYREAELEGIFYNYRARWQGTEISNNGLRELLGGEQNNDRRRGIWEASKEIGPLIAPRLRELVGRRNAAARHLGFVDYYTMELALQEFDEVELFQLLDEFRRRSDTSFRELRERLDEELAERYRLPAPDLRPWHWDDFFSQEAPSIRALDFDIYFEGLDLTAVASAYFSSIGLPVADILARSDLYEREGKDQNAFCTDIDREGDVRILCNLRPSERWMRTLLHELGHAVFDMYVPRSLPFLLRTPAHTLVTEAIAMFFGRLTRDPEWLRATITLDLDPAQEAEVTDQQRLAMLASARWILVMVYFERELYRDPEREDLNRLWWDLVAEFQFIRRPDERDRPDWATKMHLSLAPVYYHNYLLGELMASQLTSVMRSAGAAVGSVGDFLRDRIFARGAVLPWNELLREATGKPLSARHFVEQFTGEALAGEA
jgi:peptidyl-dipeptidase A